MKKTFILTLFFCYGVCAQTPVLISDLKGNNYNANEQLVIIGSTVYFRADDGISGQELWKSDGTAAGTAIVKDINPLGGSSNLRELTKAGNTLFFIAFDYNTGYELWKSNGTAAGTTIVKDIAPSSESSLPLNLTAFGSTLYFSVYNNSQLWKSDGTAAGTVMVKTFSANSSVTKIISGGNILYFTVTNYTNNTEQLWKTNGTEAGTLMLKEFVFSIYSYVFSGNTLFFNASDGVTGVELWKSNGSVVGTVLVVDLNEGEYGSSPGYLTELNGLIYFSAMDSFYKSDGTAAGTQQISNRDAYYLTKVNGSLYFVDYEDEFTIYKSNGTAGGTILLKKFERYDNQTTNFRFFGLADGSVYFVAKEYEHGEELWTTNGTPAGTLLEDDLRPGIYSGFPNNFSVDGSTVYFTATNGVAGYELWKKTGTSAAVMVKDVKPNNFDANPNNLAKLNNFLFLNATDQYSTQLFVVNTGNSNFNLQGLGVQEVSDFLAFNNKMYFQGKQYNGRELWMSDGTNISLVKDIYTGTAGGGVQNNSNPAELTKVGNFFYFAATNLGDRELWKSDGTELGTVQVKNINAGGNSYPNHLIEFGSHLYFFAISSSAYQLFKSDGSSAGTNPVPYSSAYTINAAEGAIAKTNSELYVKVNTASTGAEIFILDGTSLALLKDIRSGSNSSEPGNFTPVNDRLYFTANDGPNGEELWKTDGTPNSTEIIKDIRPGSVSSNINNLIKFNNYLFFSANDGVNGQELWRSDGTPEGTFMVKDILEGAVGSSPSNFCVVGNTLYFSAYHPKFGRELWKTDGTEGGTVLVYDLFQNGASESHDANPTQLFEMGGNLFFAADNGTSGNELFYFKPCPTGATFNQYTYSPTYTYHATQYIEAYHTLKFGRSVNYFAGKAVVLSPGFTVSAAPDNDSNGNNTFRAEARGCN
ncbi:ELWxxDGT repeat protein [Emticicia agri]|uniref:Bulb-type lectin domain-containing protein n=1 Tax=Emticicia agri TaxID=2492393 RepID=A0A4Q5LYU4_9BACT|nr:ELWxxDGT repeat protein [Emticicia agri]RYU95116.1 hypothetical protein EWM59_13790 [Emticicia agri]